MGKKKAADSAPEKQKEEKPKEVKTNKKTDEEVEIIEKFDYWGFFGLIIFNIALFYGVMSCAKEGLTKAKDQMDVLEDHTNFIYSHWNAEKAAFAEKMLETTTLWSQELTGNLTGPEALEIREQLKEGKKYALEAKDLMISALDALRNDKPIFSFETQYDEEGNLIKQPGKYQVIKEDGSQAENNDLVDKALKKLSETKSKFSNLRHQILEQDKAFAAIKYAGEMANDEQLFKVGMERITKVAAQVKNFWFDGALDYHKEEMQRVNGTAEELKTRAEAVFYGLLRVEKAQAGEPLDFDLIKEQLDEIDVYLKELKPKVDEVVDLAEKAELISSAPHTYMERVKKLIGPQHFADLRLQAAKIEKVLNLKARNELKDITAKINDYKPICMDSMDDIDLEQVESLEKNYKELQEKLAKADENFPKYKEWLDEYHKETRTWIRKMEGEIADMVKKIKGPVAKSSLIMRKAKTIKSLENKMYEDLEAGKAPEDCEECKGFNDMRYRDQIALVRRLLEEEDNRLKSLVEMQDGLTEEEMGVVMEAAEPEVETKSNYKWKSHAEKKKETEELKAQLDSLFDEI
ncbi:Oidioi.mRNA.OKI2018_I69.chr1.g256.t1.cds [Oikopleura dioica]|uniref:Oidioi.mRNA.OKI2018_I69.chr1.g256.t1.cds n=1 Tax=Oikopleura dioica TaxID=34765 RepID=A0ABN7SRG8_OIKDI|nr:Oidioi.mRNA.OKI2018_I69.chr1.g256.t1.cds [Oikopleura dioica]